MKIKLVSFLTLLFFTMLNAQTECSCCTEQHSQFDFWLGEWTVMNAEGKLVGENSIAKIEDGCILVEKWKGAQGTTGTSHNYYDPSDGTWNQLWIDNNGYILKLKGNLVAGKMVLRSDLTANKEGQQYYNQISWSHNQDDTVTQLWELYDRNDKMIRQLFLGVYHRKP